MFKTRWENVAKSDRVEVTLGGGVVQMGVVDDCTPDGSCVWVRDSLGDRRLLHRHDGYDLVKVFGR